MAHDHTEPNPANDYIKQVVGFQRVPVSGSQDLEVTRNALLEHGLDVGQTEPEWFRLYRY
jgi:hypothetical protein